MKHVSRLEHQTYWQPLQWLQWHSSASRASGAWHWTHLAGFATVASLSSCLSGWRSLSLSPWLSLSLYLSKQVSLLSLRSFHRHLEVQAFPESGDLLVPCIMMSVCSPSGSGCLVTWTLVSVELQMFPDVQLHTDRCRYCQGYRSSFKLC